MSATAARILQQVVQAQSGHTAAGDWSPRSRGKVVPRLATFLGASQVVGVFLCLLDWWSICNISVRVRST